MLSYIICFGCVHSPHVNYIPLVLYKRAALHSLWDFWCIAVIIPFCCSVPVNLCKIAAAPFRSRLHTYTSYNTTSAIQEINGASLKEHWAAQQHQVYKQQYQVYKQQYQRLQHNMGMKYKMGFFLNSLQS